MRVPADERSLADDRLDERRLAGAVWAEEADRVARRDDPVDVRQDRRAVVADGGSLEAEERPRHARRRLDRELERPVQVRDRDALQLFQRADAALRLPRLGRLRAEARDE